LRARPRPARYTHARRAHPLVHRHVRNHLKVAAEQADSSGVPGAPCARRVQCTHAHARGADRSRALAARQGRRSGDGSERPHLDGGGAKGRQERQGTPLWPEIVREARDACAELRLIGKARKRARRPTPVQSIVGATATRRSNFDAPTESLLRRVVIQTLAGVTL